jgi:hypothetical protein
LEEIDMRVLMLSTILAAGLGFAAVDNSQAASFGAGMNEAAKTNTLVDEVQYRRCRTVRVCRDGPFGRRCRIERSCRRW